MFKVIVERPRVGGGKCRKGRRLDHEDLPFQEGMSRPHKLHWRGKSLNENLSPLRRFLESRVGKYWPQVYAEICENLRPSSAVQQHVRDHLADFVATRAFIKDGEIWVHDTSRLCRLYGRLCRLDEARTRFFVHPVSGCLMPNKKRQSYFSKRGEQRAQWAAEIAERRRDIGDNRHLHKLNGCWYEVTPGPIETRWQTFAKPHGGGMQLGMGTRRDKVIDATLSDLDGGDLLGRFPISKRQLSHRELRKYGLQND